MKYEKINAIEKKLEEEKNTQRKNKRKREKLLNREKEKCGLTVSNEFQEETGKGDAKHGKKTERT